MFPSFFAWLLSLALKHWHAALFAVVLVVWAIALRFRAITIVEVAFAALILASYARDGVEAALGRLFGPPGDVE